MRLNPNNKGLAAEQRALDYLLAKGLKLQQKNFHHRFGEIDLIMRDGTTLCFIEVRARKNNDWGGAAASITRKKLEKLSKTAAAYLQQHPHKGPCRFDLLAMTGEHSPQIDWIKDILQG